MPYLTIILAFFLAACTNLSPELRWQHAEQLTRQAGWEKLRIPAGQFVLTAYAPKTLTQTDTLTVYIEGDGFAWLSGSQASPDPTPRNPLGLELALRQPHGAAVYLARPCQYVEENDKQNCRMAYWTDLRFANEVIQSANQAIGELKQRYRARELVLLGYSGGGAVAALVAARRTDVTQLITVAGNLDHRAWTQLKQLSPLNGSLNPADEWRALVNIPQTHLLGDRDEVIPRAATESYLARFPANRQPNLISIAGFGHSCCWMEQWGAIWMEYIN